MVASPHASEARVSPERDLPLATPIITDGSLDRAARFLQLARGHPMSDYLSLMGALDVSCNE